MLPVNFNKSCLPHNPGIYFFKNNDGKIIYVGKAVDLYHRVCSYFNRTPDSPKTAALIAEIGGLETIIVRSELEALILEANLIKKYLPKYNIKLTDDKDYLYVKITKELFPKIITARKNDLLDAKTYFGPFPSASIVRDTIKKLRSIFPWCSSPYNKRPCFYYHLHLCPGPCANKIDADDYNKIINRFIKFMEGRNKELQDELTREMETFSRKKEFERAQEIKKMLSDLSYLTQSTSISDYLTNPNFLEDQNNVTLLDLQQKLELEQSPERIECFDISNISGKDAVGSMVVLTHGEIDKSQYRKFKIQLEAKPNDVAMMGEVISRRFKHAEWLLPNLVLVDGGKGQVNIAKLKIQDLKLEIPVYGLAKKLELLYNPDGNIVKLSRLSPALRLLQKIRNEAHRFALNYHHKLRQSAVV